MSWAGGKGGAGVVQGLISLMPWHRVYVEPFLGGGAVMLAKRPAEWSVGVDLDAVAVMGFARAWRGGSVRDPVTREVAVRTGGGGVSLLVGDGIELLRRFPWRGDELVYADPPYLMETRRGGSLFRRELDEAGHCELLEVLVGLPCLVMVSGYWSGLYASVLAGWRSWRYRSLTRGGTSAVEWVWMNYGAVGRLHDYRFVGGGYRARERVRRRARRWVRRLMAMGSLERGLLLEAVGSVFGETGRVGAGAARVV